MFETLLKQKGNVLTHDALINAVWPNIEREPDTSLTSLRVHIHQLRRKCAQVTNEKIIYTQHKQGWYVEADVEIQTIYRPKETVVRLDITQEQETTTSPTDDSYVAITSRFAELALQDERIKRIQLELNIGEELRNSVTLRKLLELLHVDAEAAMLDFVQTNPADTSRIIDLQSRVYAEVYIHKMLRSIQQSGREADAALKAEEMGVGR